MRKRNMDTKKEYYQIIAEIWKLFRTHINTVSQITSATDSRWKTICDDFDAIEASAPEHMKRYAGAMVLLHVDELERRWRH
jgi:hypothetical protein